MNPQIPNTGEPFLVLGWTYGGEEHISLSAMLAGRVRATGGEHVSPQTHATGQPWDEFYH